MNAQTLADQLVQGGILTDMRVAAAFRSVPRHLFVPPSQQDHAYEDRPITLKYAEDGGYLSGSVSPSQTARQLQLAELAPGQNVLEIGAGTAFEAALIQHIVGDTGRVTSVEIDPDIVEIAQDNLQHAQMGQVQIVQADGAAGYAPRASYDRIIATTVLWDVPLAWLRQLRPGGLLVAPLYLDGLQVLTALRMGPGGVLYSDVNMTCEYVPLRGVASGPEVHLYLGGGSALRIYSNNAATVDGASLHLLISEDAEHCHLGEVPSVDDYWNGFVPYMMLHVPRGYNFVCYAVRGGKNTYGLHGNGFGLLSRTSAMFVADDDGGDTNCFAGVDAFLEMENTWKRWRAASSPRIDKLRIRLVPRVADGDSPEPPPHGCVYARPEHDLIAWLDIEE